MMSCSFFFQTLKAGPELAVNKQVPYASMFIKPAITTPPIEVLLVNIL